MRIIFFTIIIFVLASCGRTKKLAETNRYKETTETTEQVNETMTIERVVDTAIYIPASVDSSTFEIIPQRETIAINNEEVKVTVLIDSLTNMVTVKAQVKEKKVPIHIKEKIVTERVEKKESETSVKQVNKTSEKKVTKPRRFGWWIIGILGIVILYMFGGKLWPFAFVLRRRKDES